MINTFYDCYRILSHVYGEGSYLKQAINGEVIEPINRGAVIKICYGVLDEDITLCYYLSVLCEKNPKLPVRVILKIAVYCIEYLNKAPYAVTNSAVELLKKLGKGGASGFLNATLRKFCSVRSQIKLPEGNDAKSLSVRYSYPEALVGEILQGYGESLTKSIISYRASGSFLRFKSDSAGESYLTERGITYQKLPFCGCFKVNSFVRDDGFDNGVYTYQSVGSVAICEVISGGENLLDCCAAPGGKSVLLSEKFKSVTSCDIHPHRVKLIEQYAERMHADNVRAIECDAGVFRPEFSSSFEAVLCDVPCSGAGVACENPDMKVNKDYSSLKELNELQLKIIKNCFKYVKNGGALYYSTCSVLPRENDGIIKRFLLGEPNARVEKISSPLKNNKTEFGLQFLPNETQGAGFYVCKIAKN